MTSLPSVVAPSRGVVGVLPPLRASPFSAFTSPSLPTPYRKVVVVGVEVGVGAVVVVDRRVVARGVAGDVRPWWAAVEGIISGNRIEKFDWKTHTKYMFLKFLLLLL